MKKVEYKPMAYIYCDMCNKDITSDCSTILIDKKGKEWHVCNTYGKCGGYRFTWQMPPELAETKPQTCEQKLKMYLYLNNIGSR